MMTFLEWDRSLLLWVNGAHSLVTDSFWMLYTDRWTWIPLYLILAIALVRTYGRDCWRPLLAVGLIILLTDQTITQLIKPSVARLRPSFEPSLEGIVHLVGGYRAGGFSFLSGHAANTIGLAVFLWGYTRERWWGIPLLIFALLSGFSRIYLGVHYPSDVAAGFVFGTLMGLLLLRFTPGRDNRLACTNRYLPALAYLFTLIILLIYAFTV